MSSGALQLFVFGVLENWNTFFLYMHNFQIAFIIVDANRLAALLLLQ